MRRKKLTAYLYQIMFAGCFTLSVSSPALAGSHFQNWQGGMSKSALAKYRFRPITQDNASSIASHIRVATDYRRSYPAYSRYMAGHYRQTPPVYRAFSQQNDSRYSVMPYSMDRYAYRQHSIGPGRLSYQKPYLANSQSLPAFARQYGWEPAQKLIVRKGNAFNHYASQTNDAMETVSSQAHEYRSAPVTAQGFRYRVPVRNARYVTFSDRVKASADILHRQSYANAARASQRVAKTIPMANANPHPFTKARPALAKKGNYRFRPDQRLIQNETESVVSQQQFIPVSYKLANAKLPKNGDNPWNDWSFRPVDPTF